MNIQRIPVQYVNHTTKHITDLLCCSYFVYLLLLLDEGIALFLDHDAPVTPTFEKILRKSAQMFQDGAVYQMKYHFWCAPY